MSQLTNFTSDLAEFGLTEDKALADPRWASLLNSVYTRLNQLSHSRAVTDALPDAVLSVTDEGIILDANQTAYQIFGREKANAVTLAELMPSSIAQQTLSAINSTAQHQVTTRYEFSLDSVHFHRHFEARVFPLNGQNVILVFREITEQRWSETARTFVETYFRSLVEKINIGLLICTLEGDIVIANNALLKMLDQNDEQLLVGVNYLDLLSGITMNQETVAELNNQYAKAAHGNPYPLVTIRVNKPGKIGHRWLLVNLDVEQASESHTRQLKVIFTDITDFRNAEIALKETEEQYASLIDRVTDVIYHLDDQNEIIFLNTAWLRLTGFGIEDSLGRNILDFVHTEDKQRFLDVIQGDDRQDIMDIQLRLIKQDGTICWVSLRNQPTRSSHGALVGQYGMMIDITDQKRNEFTRAALTAKAHSVEILTRLLASISHDLRTPISIISVSNYKLSHYWDRLDVAKRIESFEQIDKQVTRINRFVEEYSDLARLDVELINLIPVPVNLIQLVHTLLQTIMSSSAQNGIRWDLEISRDEQTVLGNTDWLKKMIQHILDNALQYTLADGTITVRIYSNSQTISLEIQDTGIGIEPTDLGHVFEPLYRGDKARSINEGLAGLGLTFVQRIAQAHNANVYIDSEIGIGTTIRVDFPISNV